MRALRRFIFCCGVAALVTTLCAGAASAETFYVNQRGEPGACTSPGKHACQTIAAAVAQAEKSSAPNTIEVEPGEGGTSYEESIDLIHAADAGLSIVGSGSGVQVRSKSTPVITLQSVGGAVTVSNMSLVQSETTSGVKTTITDKGVPLTLEGVDVEDESGSGLGDLAAEGGSVTIDGGTFSMENGASGYAIRTKSAPLRINGILMLCGAESEANAGGVYSEDSTLAIANSKIGIESGSSTIDFDISANDDTSTTIENVDLKENTDSVAVALENSPSVVHGLRMEMLDVDNALPAFYSGAENDAEASSYSDLETSGTWEGGAMALAGGQATISDSRLVENAFSEVPALEYSEVDNGSDKGLVLTRSVVQGGTKAPNGAIALVNGNATLDSSEVLGGSSAIKFEDSNDLTDTLTVSASTIDAGAPGITGDAAGVSGIETIAKKGPDSDAAVKIEGSIVLEKQIAAAESGDAATVACSYSAVPSQAQSAGGGSGAITCATSSNANSEVSPLSTLFSEPFSAYELSPSSAAVDSVPAGVIALPFGITPSATDLAGNPRVLDGNGDCVAVQDRGAVELQGHAAACPPPPPPAGKAAALPHISGLSINPSTFYPAPKGATASSAKKKRYGAKVSYRDTTAASTTFTVLRVSSGRKQGKSCKKPSQKNRHGKRCTLLVSIGSFARSDKAGADGFHFSGRVHGRKLAAGDYELEALPRSSAGKGSVVEKAFKIR